MENNMKKIKCNENIRRAVTHGGVAHLDDLLAASMLINAGIPVYRRNPTKEDLEDPTVVVFDIGDQFDPLLNNYDHHQDEKTPCSFFLVAEYVCGVDPHTLRLGQQSRWADLVDRCGIDAAFQSLNKNRDVTGIEFPPRSLIEELMTSLFASRDEWLFGEGPFSYLGGALMDWFNEQVRQVRELEEACRPHRRRDYVAVQNGTPEFTVVDLTGLDIPPNKVHTALRKKYFPPKPLLYVVDSKRGPHQWALNSQDTDRIKLIPMGDTTDNTNPMGFKHVFTHANGFVSCFNYEPARNPHPDDLVRAVASASCIKVVG